MMIDQKIEKSNKIKEKEFRDVSTLIFQSFLISAHSRVKAIEKKDILLNEYIDFLSKFLESDFIKGDKEKTFFLNLIDKLTLQKELLQLRKKEITLSNIKSAGVRLGKKAQSAFTKK